MDIGPDTRNVTNPARKTLVAAHDELATTERAPPQLLNGARDPRNRRTPRYRESTDGSTPPCPQPKTPKAAPRPIRAKVLATDLDPDTQLGRVSKTV
jgi:hypothetical protein